MGEVAAAQRHWDACLVRHQQVHALADVLEQSAAIAPQADETVRACGHAGPVVGTVAQDGGDLISRYERLCQVVADIPVDQQHAPLRGDRDTAELSPVAGSRLPGAGLCAEPDLTGRGREVEAQRTWRPARRLEDIRLELTRLLAAAAGPSPEDVDPPDLEPGTE